MNGIFNNYRSNMPLIERFIKDIKYLMILIINFFKNGFKNKTILVYPEYPNKRTTIFKIAKLLNYNLTNNIKAKHSVVINWEDTTFRNHFPELEILPSKVININSSNISKIYVDKIFNDVFGYCTIIDPEQYKGKIVRKSDLNAKHDGEILNGPLKSIDRNSIYQILIDNSLNEKLVEDIRVPIIKNTLDFVYIKHRDINERFKNTTVKTDYVDIKSVLSEKEITLINSFCNKLNFEFGELDILRNKDDNKIYIVDINNTPYGPPANISKENSEKALKILAINFLGKFHFNENN